MWARTYGIDHWMPAMLVDVWPAKLVNRLTTKLVDRLTAKLVVDNLVKIITFTQIKSELRNVIARFLSPLLVHLYVYVYKKTISYSFFS